jgi:hypothetical protein
MRKLYWANLQNTVKMCTYQVLVLQRNNTGETELNKTDLTLRGVSATVGAVGSNKCYIL